MAHRIAKSLVLVSLALSVGLQWTFVQSIAWMGMVIDYSSEMSLTAAFEKAVDGEQPCQLCRFAEERQQEEQGQSSFDPVSKLKLIADAQTPALRHPRFVPPLPSPQSFRSDAIPAPFFVPPRAA